MWRNVTESAKNGQFNFSHVPVGVWELVVSRSREPNREERARSTPVEVRPLEVTEVEVRCARASLGTGNARVTVLGHEGLPAEGAWVLLESVAGIVQHWSRTRTCDKNGWAEFSTVPVGEYVVTPFPPGKRPVLSRWRPNIVPPNAERLTIEPTQTVDVDVELGER